VLHGQLSSHERHVNLCELDFLLISAGLPIHQKFERLTDCALPIFQSLMHTAHVQVHVILLEITSRHLSPNTIFPPPNHALTTQWLPCSVTSFRKILLQTQTQTFIQNHIGTSVTYHLYFLPTHKISVRASVSVSVNQTCRHHCGYPAQFQRDLKTLSRATLQSFLG
jgi:hypothetical protein